MRRIDLGGEGKMREHKAAATTAGILYIAGTVAGVLSVVVSAPVRDARDPLAYAVEHSGALVTTGLLVLVMGLQPPATSGQTLTAAGALQGSCDCRGEARRR
jgi:hypothetical protein